MVTNNESGSNNVSVELEEKRREVKLKVAKIIQDVILKDKPLDSIDVKDEEIFRKELNSINFIGLIVAIETEFNIEFDDSALQFGNFSSPYDIVDYIIQKTSESA